MSKRDGDPTTGVATKGFVAPASAQSGTYVRIFGEEIFLTRAVPRAGKLTIGRSDKADLRVDHPSLSRLHVEIILDPPLRIRDLGSTNGTRVGGRRLAPKEVVELPAGAIVEIGALMIQIASSTEPPTARDFRARLDEVCARTRRAGGSFAILLLLLKHSDSARVRESLAAALSPADLLSVGRSHEYQLLLLNDTRDADVRARDIVTAMMSRGVLERSGYAGFPADGLTADALLAAADRRMFAGGDGNGERPGRASLASSGLADLAPLVNRIAPSMINVVLLGETGVGKGVMAEEIHRLSPRAARPFLTVNCGTLNETLIESELFGYERGAFTGAVAAKPGLLETAEGGTVFIDEVGELPLTLQVKLLRVLEARQITPLGGVVARSIDVRFIAATNRDLEADVARKTFREDLYFRLCGASLKIPPLRERVAQIIPLARDFLAAMAAGSGKSPATLSPAAVELLEKYHWPGNIRELRNVIERAAVLAGDTITPAHLPVEKMRAARESQPAPSGGVPSPTLPPPMSLRAHERAHILEALSQCGGNQRAAAKMLGISRNTLAARMESYGIPRPRKR